jgi:heme exporter protein A
MHAGNQPGDWMRLVAQDLACERGGRLVFGGVSFSVEAGQLMQLTGANGAGKSSLLRLIAGLADRTGGQLSLEGADPEELTIGQRAHLIGHLDAIKPALTVKENLQFWDGFLGGGDVEAAISAFALEPLAGYPAQYLSAGQKRRLALSRLALIPRVLWLLDEPTVGLDQASQERLHGLLDRHLRANGLVIAATHVPLPVAAHVTFNLDPAKVAA